jgi:hypothetical protein
MGIARIEHATPFDSVGPVPAIELLAKCTRKLGVEGVDLCGGTRHGLATALRQFRAPEEIKRSTMHSTNKAFERYFQFEGDDLREIYGDTRLAPPGTRLAPKKEGGWKANLLKFKE